MMYGAHWTFLNPQEYLTREHISTDYRFNKVLGKTKCQDSQFPIRHQVSVILHPMLVDVAASSLKLSNLSFLGQPE